MTPGDRMARDERWSLILMSSATAWGICAFLAHQWPWAITSAVLFLAAVGFGIDLWIVEQGVKRRAREDMRRYDERHRRG